MKNKLNRSEFIKTLSAGTIGLGVAGSIASIHGASSADQKRIGIIGLDTSHSTAFTKALNDPAAGPEFSGFKVVAAYPNGSLDIKSSTDRIPAYTEEVKKSGVEIVGSIEELLQKVDFVLLETNDGRRHFEQALIVLKAGKRMFIDKPVAASLSDAIAIFEAARKYNVSIFSSSSLRYISGAKEISEGSVGKVLGADTYSPATLEKTHPDLFWYGVHGVEILFKLMGTGCHRVSRMFTENTDVVVGVWKDDRIGTFRGTRSGKGGYGGTAFGEKGIITLGEYQGYNPLLLKIIEFFNTGIAPVTAEETIEIFTFMQAAEVSKQRGGTAVGMQEVLKKARDEAKSI